MKKIKIESSDGTPQHTIVKIGKQFIPCHKISIVIEAGEVTKVILEVAHDHILLDAKLDDVELEMK